MRSPRTLLLLAGVFASVSILAWISGLRWWSLLVAVSVAAITYAIHSRLTQWRSNSEPGSSEELAVVYLDEAVGWRVLVGGERCSRVEAEDARRALQKRGYQVRVIPRRELAKLEI
jgi:hypothetical protein